MGLGDIGSAFLIIIIFCLIQLSITLSIGIAQLRNNWEKYKCNPGVIPFAGLVGHDPVTTFNECTKETLSGFMGTFLDPIYTSLNSFADSGNLFVGILESLKLGLNVQQGGTLNFIEDLGVRLNILINELSRSFITVSDLFGKVGAMVSVIYYLILTSAKMGDALCRDLPGTAVSYMGIECHHATASINQLLNVLTQI